MRKNTEKKKLLMFLIASALLCALFSSSVMAAVAAKIGSKSYSTVAEAFAKVKNGQTIVLQRNVRMTGGEYASLHISGKCTLNLNKKTLYLAGQDQIVVEKGTLTVKNGTVRKTSRTGRIFYAIGKNSVLKITSGTYVGSICAQDGAKLYIDGGSFKAIPTNNAELITIVGNSSAVISKGTFKGDSDTALIQNYDSKLSVKGGTFHYTHEFNNEYTDTFTPGFDNHAMICTDGETSQTIIYGGSFVSSSLCFSNAYGSTVKITSGSFTSKEGGVILNYEAKSVRILGGSFRVYSDWGLLYNHNAKCIISGGTFRSEWSLLENNSGSLTVTGGTFSSSLDTEEIATVLAFGGTTKIKGGTFKAPKTYGYWKSSENGAKLTVSSTADFKRTKGKKTTDLWTV